MPEQPQDRRARRRRSARSRCGASCRSGGTRRRHPGARSEATVTSRRRELWYGPTTITASRPESTSREQPPDEPVGRAERLRRASRRVAPAPANPRYALARATSDASTSTTLRSRAFQAPVNSRSTASGSSRSPNGDAGSRSSRSSADPSGGDATGRVDHRERGFAVVAIGRGLQLVLVGVGDHRAPDARARSASGRARRPRRRRAARRSRR